MSRPPLIIIDILTLPDLYYRSTASKHEVDITSALLLFSLRIFAITSSSAGVRYVVWGTYRPSHNYSTSLSVIITQIIGVCTNVTSGCPSLLTINYYHIYLTELDKFVFYEYLKICLRAVVGELQWGGWVPEKHWRASSKNSQRPEIETSLKS